MPLISLQNLNSNSASPHLVDQRHGLASSANERAMIQRFTRTAEAMGMSPEDISSRVVEIRQIFLHANTIFDRIPTREALAGRVLNEFSALIPKMGTGGNPYFSIENVGEYLRTGRENTPINELSVDERRIRQFVTNLGTAPENVRAVLSDLRRFRVTDLADGTSPQISRIVNNGLTEAAETAERATRGFSNTVGALGSRMEAIVSHIPRIDIPNIKLPRVGGILTAAVLGSLAVTGAAQAAEADGLSPQTARLAARGAAQDIAVTAIDPTGLTGMALDALRERSNRYRMGLSSERSLLENEDLRNRLETTSEVALRSANNPAVRAAVGAFPALGLSALPLVAVQGVESSIDRMVRTEIRSIDQQQEALVTAAVNRGQFPETITLNGREIETHVVLRDPARLNAMRNYYTRNNQNGQHNDELQTLREFERLETRRDTMIDRAEARGDITAAQETAFKNGTDAASRRTGFTPSIT